MGLQGGRYHDLRPVIQVAHQEPVLRIISVNSAEAGVEPSPDR